MFSLIEQATTTYGQTMEYFFPSYVIDSQEMEAPAEALKKRVDQFVANTLALCKRNRIDRIDYNESYLESTIAYQKEGSELLEKLKERPGDETLLFRVDAAARKLLQLEEALKAFLRHPIKVHPPICLDERICKKIQGFVSDFEAAAYGSRFLHQTVDRSLFELEGFHERNNPLFRNNRYLSFPRASSKYVLIQPTNWSRESLAVSIQHRSYGYQLVRILLHFREPEEWVDRMEAALLCMVEDEKVLLKLPHENPPSEYFGFEKIEPGVHLINGQAQALCKRKNREQVNFESYLDQQVDSRSLRNYVDATKSIYAAFFA